MNAAGSNCILQQQSKLDSLADDVVYDDENDEDNSCDGARTSVLFEAGATQDLFNPSDSLYDDSGEVDDQLFTANSLESFELLSGILQQSQSQELVALGQDVNKQNEILCRQQQTISGGQTFAEQPQSTSQTQTLSFGSSEEVLAMVQNQLLHEGATLSRHSSPSAGDNSSSNVDLVSVAFSDDILQQLLLMVMRDGATSNVSSGHQVCSLPAIAETPVTSLNPSATAVTVQPVLQVLHGNSQSPPARILSDYLKVEPGLTTDNKPTQSLDNLCQFMLNSGSSAGYRRASTGSLSSSQQAAGFRLPQVNFYLLFKSYSASLMLIDHLKKSCKLWPEGCLHTLFRAIGSSTGTCCIGYMSKRYLLTDSERIGKASQSVKNGRNRFNW